MRNVGAQAPRPARRASLAARRASRSARPSPPPHSRPAAPQWDAALRDEAPQLEDGAILIEARGRSLTVAQSMRVSNQERCVEDPTTIPGSHVARVRGIGLKRVSFRTRSCSWLNHRPA